MFTLARRWGAAAIAAVALTASATAFAAPSAVVPQPVEYVQPVIDGAAQFARIGFTREVPNPFQPAYTYVPLLAPPDGDATVDWYDITMRQVIHNNAGLVDDLAAGTPLLPGFPVWAYGDTASGTATYPGMTLSATKGRPVKVTWRNALPTPHILPNDPSIMCGPPGTMVCPDNRAVVHVHGAHVYDHSDGLPEQWFTPPDVSGLPMNFGTQWAPNDRMGINGTASPVGTFVYPMDQEAATLWYHDHATGVTRLNAYAGLAGFFPVHDANELAMQAANQLPTFPYETGIAIQDKMFWATPPAGAPAYVQLGAMAFPNATLPGLPVVGQPSITAEMFGNVMLVNGVAWPKMTVEPRMYRIRVLNGCDSRVMILKLTTGDWQTGVAVPFWIIGNEQGFVNAPLQVTSLTILPGMRYDLIMDFTSFGDQAGAPLVPAATVNLLNVGPDGPYDGTAPVSPLDPAYPMADPASTGQVMQFVVATQRAGADVTLPANLLDPANGGVPIPATPAPGTAVVTRQVYLKEASDVYGRLMLTLNLKGLLDPISELVPLGGGASGTQEVWEVANITPDSHPIHLHLVKFRIIDREPIAQLNNGLTATLAPYPAVLPILPRDQAQTWLYAGAGAAAAVAPQPYESGWLDTFESQPGTLTRLEATFDIPGLYVWHCHILSHEEYDMMREYGVSTPPTGVRLTSTGTTQPVSATPTAVTFFANGLTGLVGNLPGLTLPAPATSQAFEFKYWLKSPGTGWAVVKNWSTGSNWTWTPPANTAGTYYVQVDLRTPGTAVRQFAKVMSYAVVGPTAASVGLAPENGSQPMSATPAAVLFTATPAPAGTYEYRFWLKDPVTGWAVKQNYSTTATWNWDPPPNTLGGYYVQVDCRPQGSTGAASVSRVTSYGLVGNTPTAVNITDIAPPSPQTAATATPVTFTAEPTPAGTYEYKFWVKDPVLGWQVKQNYSTVNTFVWTPPAVPGQYWVEVDIRPVGSTLRRSAAKVVGYLLQ